MASSENPSSIETTVRRQLNLQAIATFAGLLALLWLLNLTPVPGWVCETIGLDADSPANLLGQAYWDDCFGGPLGDFAAGSLPRPDDLNYAPEADEFLAALENLAAQEKQIESTASNEE